MLWRKVVQFIGRPCNSSLDTSSELTVDLRKPDSNLTTFMAWNNVASGLETQVLQGFLTTQPATDREKRLTGGISHSLSRRFLSACFQTLSFSVDFRFRFCYHLCQQFFALFLTVSVYVPGVLFAVRPDRRVAAFPEFFVDLGDAPGPRFTPLSFVGLECTGNRLSRCYLSLCL